MNKYFATIEFWNGSKLHYTTETFDRAMADVSHQVKGREKEVKAVNIKFVGE